MATKKFALVLSGGGFKGAFQLGVLQWLQQPQNWKRFSGLDTPMHFHIIAGVSVGALNGVMTAMNKPGVLNDLWERVIVNGGNEIYESDFVDGRGRVRLNATVIKDRLLPNLRLGINLLPSLIFNRKKFFEKIGAMIEADLQQSLPRFRSLATNKALYQKLQQHVRKADVQAGTQFLCGFVSLQDGQYYKVLSNQFVDDEAFCKGILASTAMPIVWDTVPSAAFTLDGSIKQPLELLDGGLRNTSPLGDIIDLINADTDADYHILIINCSTGKTEVQNKAWNIATIALRSLTEITLEEIFNNDIETFQNINNLVIQAGRQGATLTRTNKEGRTVPLRRFSATIINPDPGVLGNVLDTEPELMRRRIAHGQQKAAGLMGPPPA